MKQYNLKNYNNNFTEAKPTLLADLNEALQDLEITIKNHSDCEILEVTDIKDFNGRQDFMTEISCKAGIKSFYLRAGIDSETIKLPESKQEEFNELCSAVDALYADYKALRAEEQRLANIEYARLAKIQQEKIAKALELKALKEAEVKRQKKIANEVAKFDNLKYSKNRCNAEVGKTLYEVIGWVAKHGKTLSAAMPDFLEDYFVGVFGDVKRRVVDSKKKGPAGWTSQWALSMNLTLDTSENIPASLLQYMSKGKKANVISKASFVYMLAEDFGFKFASEQDINKIRATIPNSHLAEFELGYTA